MWRKINRFRTKQISRAELNTPQPGLPDSEVSCLVCNRCWEDVFKTEKWRNILYDDETRLEYQATGLEIEKSAEDGCGWCRLMRNGITRGTDHAGLFSVKSIGRGSDVTPTGCRGLETSFRNPAESLTEQAGEWRPRADFHLFADAGTLAASFVPARPLRNDVHSVEAYEQIAEWLAGCQKHASCTGTAKDHVLPARLIQVEPNLRLIPTEGLKGRYLCLFYCWGTSRNSILTRENFSEYHDKLEFQDLPRTIRDAIEVTRRMGMKYLWVDALCIVQDSEEDKAHNLSVMHSIYRNSLLTIVAARALNVEQGFLGTGGDEGAQFSLQRSPYEHFKIPIRRADGAWVTVSATHCYKAEFDEQYQPINRRAWTLQEMILPPRLLVYNTHTMQWKCAQGTQNFGASIHIINWETRSPSVLSHRQAPRKTGSSSMINKSATASLLNAKAASGNTVMQELPGTWLLANALSVEVVDWIHLIETYTKRRATVIGDRLPAVAGIAATWPRSGLPVYLAGLWSFSVAVQLMWQVKRRSHDPDPPERRAPSWSWASVDGEVTHYTYGQAHLKRIFVYGTAITGGHTTPRYANVPFGEVTSGVLRTHTSLCRRWHEPKHSRFGHLLAGAVILRTSPPHPANDVLDGHIEAHMDEGKDYVAGWVYCMPLLRSSDHDIAGLLLVPAGAQYRRVGWFDRGRRKDFEPEPQQVVELI